MDLIKLDDSNKDKIKSSISQKLAAILGQEDDEDVLPEYVMVMIANQKTKEQVRGDLDAFLGDQSAGFTDWLWDMLSSAKHAIQTPQVQATPSPKPLNSEEVRSVFSNDRNGKARERSNDSREDRHREQSPVKSVFASVITVPPPPKRSILENPAPSRLVLHAMGEAVKSVPSHSDTRMDTGDKTDGMEAVEDGARDRKYKSGRRTGSVFDRLGSGHRDGGRDRGDGGRDRGDSGRDRGDRGYDRIQDRTDSRGRDRMNDRHERSVPARDEPVTFTITLNGAEETERKSNKRQSLETKGDVDMGEEETAAEGETEENAKKVKKLKCQFWPNCKNGDSCPYAHPTVPCKLFPACPYAENCLYIHPAVPCRYGNTCKNATCTYSHPPAVGTSSEPAHKAVPCKHGFSCARDGCTFAHPPEACKFGERCTRSDCAYAHGKGCRFGVSCVIPGCTFAHYKDAPHKNVLHEAPQKDVPCWFGANCTNIACKFQHNIAKKEEDEAMVEASISDISATLPPTPPREPVAV